MKPTVGRIVHYQSYGTPGGEFLSEPRAAVVTSVTVPVPGDGEETVSLFIMNPTGVFLNQGVRYSEEPKAGHWNWPPKI